MSHHGYYQGGATSPTGQLVPDGYYGYNHHNNENGFIPQHPNPFLPGLIDGERDEYFRGPGYGQPQGPPAGSPNRPSKGRPPSSDTMIPLEQMDSHPGIRGYPHYSYDGIPGMPPMPYPGHFSQRPSPSPPEEYHHSRSKRGKPRPKSVHHDYSDDDHH